MSDLGETLAAPPRPCVAFALAREAMSFWKRFPARQRVREAPCRAWLAGPPGRTLLVLQTGLGRPAMESAVRWALGERGLGGRAGRPLYLLVAGFSGALQPGRPVGHLVLADEVVDEHGGRWPPTWPGERWPWREGGRTPDRSAPEPERGRVLTADALAADPAGKRALGVRYGALAVDMESSAAARLCHESGVAFGCLRAVSDDADTTLSPELVGLLRAGRPSPGAVLRALLRRPALARELLALARNTRIAADRLARALGELL